MSTLRVCSEPGCSTLHSETRSGLCAEHEREADRKRGTSKQRGYTSRHRRIGGRAIRGATTCETCGEPFTDANPATRGHRVDVRNGGTPSDGYLAQCRRCNYGWSRAVDTGSDLR